MDVAMSGNARPSVWRWPVVIAVASTVGLVSALVGDGWLDAVSWLALAAPVVIAIVALSRR